MNDADALQQAVRLLARRPLTEREMREALASRSCAAASIDAACARLLEQGYLDDRALAMDYIRTRADRLGHGPERWMADLARRGVAEDVARSALAEVIETGDVDPREALHDQVLRRLRDAEVLDRRGYARVYNALLRAGFDEDSVRRELAPYRDERDHPDAIVASEIDDDFR